jgi:hypothetical protein
MAQIIFALGTCKRIYVPIFSVAFATELSTAFLSKGEENGHKKMVLNVDAASGSIHDNVPTPGGLRIRRLRVAEADERKRGEPAANSG